MKTSARLAAVWAAAAALLSMALLSMAGCDKLKARDQLNKGVQAYKNANYEQAINYFQTAVGLDKSLKTAKLYLATAYAQQYVPDVDQPANNRNAQQAIEAYKAVLQDNANDVNSLKGIAYLYMNMRKFDDSRSYYKKVLDVDPNDPEAYYSVGVIDWTSVYKDLAERKKRVNLKVDEDLSAKKDQKLCEEAKAVDEVYVEDGLKMLQIAAEKRADYDDAMAYINLLYRQKGDLECGDAEAHATDIKMAEDWIDKAMGARKRKAAAASKKNTGGIILDTTPTPQK